MWTMPPADEPLMSAFQTRPASTMTDSAGKEAVNGKAHLPTTVLSSHVGTSSIAGGSAACYDGVRDMLCSQPRWEEEQEEVLLEPYNYLASRPGKEVRSRMIDAFNVWLKVPEDKVRVIRKVIGMLHTSSLLVDDVEDSSTLRRGAPVAHAVYGVPQTINTANYVYFLVFAELYAMGRDGGNGSSTVNSTATSEQKCIEEMIVDEMLNLHRGQGMDLYWRDNLVCPTEAEYVEMVNNKTSGLLRIVIKLMVAHSPVVRSEDKGALLPLVNLIGLLFQVRDDFMNLRSGDYALNKGYCEDLSEGKFSFPLIHAIRASSKAALASPAASTDSQEEQATAAGRGLASITDQQHLLAVLQTRPKDAETKRVVVEFMQTQTKSFDYTCDVMTRLDRLVRQETVAIEARLGAESENGQLRAILAALRKGWFQTP